MHTAFSSLGNKLSARCGILELMDDLGQAMTTDPTMRMLGGGNPAHIPAMQAIWRERMIEMLADGGAYDRMLGNYDPPRGNPHFLQALAEFLQAECGWNVRPENLAVTPGGQTALFMLFNLLGGTAASGEKKRVLMPLVPEYIGYENQGCAEDFFIACRPLIETLPDNIFKYRVDFDAVDNALKQGVAAMCVSRPTNPSGNVLSDEEVQRLSEMAREHGVPFIIDGAYGLPFPGAIFTDATPQWNESMVLTLSLSKLGLPGTRTGIVVASPEIAASIAAMTAVIGLANTNMGQQLTLPLLRDRSLGTLSREVIRPFYIERSQQSLDVLHSAFRKAEVPYAVHRSEGAFFLWLWLPKLAIPTRELYQKLKARKVLVVPGEYFFYGLGKDGATWDHQRQCLRLTYSQAPEIVREGIEIIADEASKVCV
jgi:valine--pyruvate aminotransferase